MSDMDLLERLDEQWSAGSPADLPALLHQVPTDQRHVSQELCAADLEWRWRSDESPADETFPANPRADDYAAMLEGQWQDIQCQKNIMEAEWCARCVWGDAPDVDEFAARLPTLDNWSTELTRQLHSLVPWTIELTSPSLKHPVAFGASGNFVVGRQGRGDPPAPAWVEKSDRVIIANSHFRIISRAQLRIRRTRVREMEMTNVSQTTRHKLGNTTLFAKESTRLSFPCSISVGEVNMTFSLSDPLQTYGTE